MMTSSTPEQQAKARKNLADLLQVKGDDVALSRDAHDASNLRISLSGEAVQAYGMSNEPRHVPRLSKRLPKTLDVTPVLAELAGAQKRLPSISSRATSSEKKDNIENVTFHLGDENDTAIARLAALSKENIAEGRTRIAELKAEQRAKGVITR